MITQTQKLLSLKIKCTSVPVCVHNLVNRSGLRLETLCLQIADAIKEKSGGKMTFTQKMKWTVPDVQGLGEFTCSVQLHPDVVRPCRMHRA